MRSYDQLCDESNLMKIISYLLKVDLLLVIYHLTYLIFLVNLSNQSFESTYVINLLTISQAYGILLPLTNMYTYDGILLPNKICMI